MIKKHTDENTPEENVINPRLNNTLILAPGSPKSGYNPIETDISNNNRRDKASTAQEEDLAII